MTFRAFTQIRQTELACDCDDTHLRRRPGHHFGGLANTHTHAGKPSCGREPQLSNFHANPRAVAASCCEVVSSALEISGKHGSNTELSLPAEVPGDIAKPYSAAVVCTYGSRLTCYNMHYFIEGSQVRIPV